ncbi:hypothetical protein OAV92_02110 [Crocinitomicaceae bacterium]|jgi:hypothetical protein|nr:hypothetical protein [Crocinitomicaceae bacterium]
MRYLIICLFSILMSNQSIAQDESLAQTPHHFGLQAGVISGFGFSYRYWPGKLGVQVTGIPIFGPNNNLISGGVNGLYLIRDNRVVDLYGYAGGQFLRVSGDSFGDQNTIMAGAGLGIKFDLWKVVNLNFQAGYAGYSLNDSPLGAFAGGWGIYYHL